MAGTKASGRKPKPLAVLKGEGNRGHRSKLDDMVEPEAKGLPVCPGHLTGPEKAIWNAVLQYAPIDTLHRCDGILLELLAVNLARLRQANAMIAKSGLIVRGPQGAIANPLVRVSNGAANVVRAIAAEIGLSPVSRARLMRLEDFATPDDTAFESYVFGPDDETWYAPQKPGSKRRGNGSHLN